MVVVCTFCISNVQVTVCFIVLNRSRTTVLSIAENNHLHVGVIRYHVSLVFGILVFSSPSSWRQSVVTQCRPAHICRYNTSGLAFLDPMLSFC